MTDTPITSPVENRPVGRPTNYTKELAVIICNRIANGESLKKICSDDGMPERTVVYDWLEKHEEFTNMYARAREDQADTLAEEIIELSDQAAQVIKGDDKSDSARVQAKHLQIESRKWTAAKLRPRRYGEKLDVTSMGKRIEAPLIVSPIEPRDANPQA